MNRYYELYGSRAKNQDEVKNFLQDNFGYIFTGRTNDDDGDYWDCEQDEIRIKIQNNIDLGDNVPRLEQHKDFPVLVYISLLNTPMPSSDEFVCQLHHYNLELLGRIKWEGRIRTVLFGDGCI